MIEIEKLQKWVDATDAGSEHVNLRDTSGNALIGQKTSAASVPVVLPSDQVVKTIPDLVGPSIDAFGGLRVSQVMILGAFSFAQSPHSLSFQSLTATGGTFTHVTANSCVRLSVTTASGSSAIYQSRRYHRYSPGESHRFTVACPIGSAKTNVRKRIGTFDSGDGLFLEQTGTDVALVVRSSASGSPVDTRFVKGSWNVDNFDGTGPSGITINFALHNILFVDYSWHGAGRIRFGFFVNGRVFYAHDGFGGNNQALPWCRSPLFPFRFEIANTGTTASATDLDIVACHMAKESLDAVLVVNAFSRSSGRTSVLATSTLKPVISIRPKTTFSGITNRIPILPVKAQMVTPDVVVILCQIVLNATLTGASFASVATTSVAEFDTAATAMTGGTVIAEFYVAENGETNVELKEIAEEVLLGLDIAGTTADILTVATISTGSNAAAFGAIWWQEFQ